MSKPIYRTLPQPPASKRTPSGVNPRSGEVMGAIMENQSQENVDSWWEIFTEMYNECRECADWRRKERHQQ